ncbi:hypothetical protein HYZ97_01550 [Candidatus Pacearchaeota archaeon]|nr:hypothetical protein [Candidatus Pacearchaeota archaeon]
MSSVMHSFFRALRGITKTADEWRDARTPEQQYVYLMESGKMKGKHLGSCLDSIRRGGLNTCYWPLAIPQLMEFIEKWRVENNDNEQRYHELAIEELYLESELPHIDLVSCPREEEHTEKIQDGRGRIRCFHVEEQEIEAPLESYNSWDEHAQMARLNWMHTGDSEEKGNGRESALETIIDPCYAIISDREVILPFETILQRLNLQPAYITNYCGGTGLKLCRRLDKLPHPGSSLEEDRYCTGHEDRNNAFELFGDGWDLAYYVLKWKQQTPSHEPPWRALWEEQHTPDRSAIVYND